jgi:hypothetical protein
MDAAGSSETSVCLAITKLQDTTCERTVILTKQWLLKVTLPTSQMTLLLHITTHLATLIWFEYLTNEEAEKTRRFVISSYLPPTHNTITWNNTFVKA